MDLLGRYAITITICNSNDASESHTRKCTRRYKLHKSQEKINDRKNMNVISLPKMKNELETRIQAVMIYSSDKRMEFGIEKCAMLMMKSGKQQMTEGIDLPNHGKFRALGKKETYIYLEILEADTIKYTEMKEKIKKRVSQEN